MSHPPTGYEVQMYRHIEIIARALHSIDKKIPDPATPTTPAPVNADTVVELRFAVRDRDTVRAHYTQLLDAGADAPAIDDLTDGQLIAELLLHSNPAIAAYVDYGIELIGDNSR
jgi:hypothetical protein